MKVSRILQRKGGAVATMTADRPIPEVVAELRARDIGAVVIVDEHERIAGILSERDIVRALADHGPDLSGLAVRDLMTAEVARCEPHHDVNDVMKQMSAGRFRHVPVVEADRLVGIISIGDAVNARIQELEQEAEHLQRYIAG